MGYLVIIRQQTHCLPANRFDGKSDGKNLFAIRCQIFTVKLNLQLLKSLQIKGFCAFQIVGLGNS